MESVFKPQHTLHMSSSGLTNATAKLVSLISSCFHIPIDYFLTKLPIALLTHKIPYQSSIPNLLMASHHTLNKIQSHYQHPLGPEYMIWCLLILSLSVLLLFIHSLLHLFWPSLILQIWLVCSCVGPKQNVISLISAIYSLVCCIHWQNLMKAQLLRKSGKCRLQTPSFGSTGKRINEQMWS